MKINPKRIATLTSKENHAWEFAFCFYLGDNKKDSQADEMAWRDLCLEFPRLRKYAGCR